MSFRGDAIGGETMASADGPFDIFVSYAHVDNEKPAGAEEGWVSTLIACLRSQVAQQLGRPDAFSLWMDYELRGAEPVTPTILGKVRAAATFLLVLSNGYLESRWCRQELSEFLKLFPHGGDGRVFIVEFTETERPEGLADLNSVKFWDKEYLTRRPRTLGWPLPHPYRDKDQVYYLRVQDLAEQLAAAIRRLRGTPAHGPAQSTEPRRTVYLAQVTDDLEAERDAMRRFIDQAGFNVVPAQCYRQDPSAFQEACRRDLACSEMFVQLLSGVPGKKPVDLPQGYARLQLELAQEKGLPILQWRNPLLNMTAVEDADHSRVLEATTVRAEPIEDFKQAVETRLRKEQEVAASRRSLANAFVFVDMQSRDRDLADQVCAVIRNYPMAVGMPLEVGLPDDLEKDLEANLSECHALILVYGHTPATWVRGRLRQYMKKLRQLPALAVCEGPPEDKPPIDMMLPYMRILNCRRQLDEPELRRFLDSVVASAG